jgi:nucleotide-binding universal stress UspA family protein
VYARLLVPYDGSHFAQRALSVAAEIARSIASPVHVAGFALTDSHRGDIAASIDALTAPPGVTMTSSTAKVDDIVAAIAAEVDREPGTLVCMSSVGRSHSAPLLGSVAEGVLRETFGPTLLLGPAADPASFHLRGPLVVCYDGSDTSSSVLPIAAQWAIALHVDPWVVTVLAPGARTDDRGVPDSAAVARVAHQMQADIGRTVNFEVVHGHDSAAAICEFARSIDAAAIAVSTHGASGVRRAVLGSVAMAIVHEAPCPVLVHRPPHLPS